MLPDLDWPMAQDYLEAYQGVSKVSEGKRDALLGVRHSGCGSPRHCAEAFATFTENLCKDWTFKNLGVAEAYPNRNPNSH